MTDDLCPVCRGTGNILTLIRGMEWWTCGVCFGSGVTVQYGPPTIHCHSWHDKFAKIKVRKQK